MSEQFTNEIAIIGMAGRYPNAKNLHEFWERVVQGQEFANQLSNEEALALGATEEQVKDPTFVKVAGVLEDMERFDAAFFGYNPREVSFMDPQQRHFLEVCWEALEDAGYDPAAISGRVGVFGGSAMDTYLVLNIATNPQIMTPPNKVHIQVGNDNSYLTTRVSFKLGLKGPSHTLQCACSTSLVATHVACQSLLNWESDVALVGGSTVHSQGQAGYQYLPGGVASPDGKCRTFDAQGQGPVFNSGVAVVVLKRLEDALEDGDQIYAVIKGTAINNDGSVKVSYAAPSIPGQAAVIAEALANAGVSATSIGYVEAHGTATPLGDPIEVAALTQVYRTETDKKQFCGIGSVKSNVGHLDAAAGVTSLIKAVLCLKHQVIPASLHFNEPNPRIDFANSPFYVVTERQPWLSNGQPRRAGVSSFGIGGTNAHAIVEEAPQREPGSPSRPVQLLMLSARSENALAQAATNLATHLRQHSDLNLADTAYTLQTGRRAFDYRRVIVCSSSEEAIAGLEMSNPQRVITGVRQGVDRPVVFMFSGQGSQYAAMATELYEHEPVFREVVDKCCDLLRPIMGLDLRPLLLGQTPGAAAQLNETQFTQPALFVTEYALAHLWQTWGVRPAAMIGHSIGEYVAACLAGVFPLENALHLVAERGRLMQSLPSGSMLAVSLSEAAAQPFLTANLSIAALNEPARCVVSGPDEAIEALMARLDAQSVSSQRLHTSHAFHSAMMDPILHEFTTLVRRLAPQAPEHRFISNVSGTWITPEQATDPTYWATHLRQAVRFADGVGTLLRENPHTIFLEVGPGQALTTLTRRHSDKGNNHLLLSSLRHPQDSGSNHEFLLRSLGQLWAADVPIDWISFYAAERRYRVSLPTYPFERQRYWIDPGLPGLYGVQAPQPDTAKKVDVADWFYLPSWKRSLPPLAPAATEEAQTWVLFMDSSGVGAALSKCLREKGRRVIGVHSGEQFNQDGPDCFTLNPFQPADYDSLIQALVEQQIAAHHIVQLWNVTENDTPLSHNFYSLLYLAQALGRLRDGEGQVNIRVITNQMQAIANESVLHPTKAAALGPCKVITQEYEQITCQSIDITWPPADSRQARRVIELLAAELLNDIQDSVIAYRGADRWVQSYEPAPLPPAAAALPAHLRHEGVYLITGGLGGLGLEVAYYLARTVQARLVLTSRSGLPARHEWTLALSNGHDAVRRKIEQVQALEAAGAAVLVLAADVTDHDQMEAVLSQTIDHFGALHGVFHAAGIPGAGIVQLKTEAKAAAVLAPKVTGSLILNELLQERAIDFFCLFSSITAVTGGFGQVDYCAANAFLDALAQANMAQGGPYTIAINWDAWQKVGMAVDTASLRALPGSDDGSFAVVDHPLVTQYQRETADKASFRTPFSPATHWVLSEHHVVGIPTIPGATYPEIAVAAFRHHTGAEGVEIRDLLFITPFMTAEDETKMMYLSLQETDEGFAFQARSQQEHVRGVLRPLTNPVPEQRDIPAIIGRCVPVDLATVGEAGMAQFVDTGPRWDCIEAVFAGNHEGLAVLRLAEAFTEDWQQYNLHPALMDIATAFAIHSIGEGNYLPLAYKRLRVFAAFSNPLYCYVQVPQQAANTETVHIDVTIMDAAGRVLVEIEGFSVKRVSADAAHRLAEAAQQNAAALAADNSSTNFRNLSDGILPEEGVEVLSRILNAPCLPQVIVSTRDLAVTIEAFNTFDPKTFLGGTAGTSRRASEIHARPDLPIPFVAPRTEAEQRIADLWQAVLGIDRVGIHDNFFELGGDSLLGTQIMAQAKEAGIELTPAQFFQHQTIAEIAALMDGVSGDSPAAAPMPDTVMKEEQMLSQLDQLSEAEMDALLAEMLVEESGE